MATTVALAQGNGNLGYGCLTVSIEQLGTMQDNGIVLLGGTGQEAGNVNEGNDGDIECVAETNEACTLTAAVAVQYTCHLLGLVGNDTYTLTVEACETDDEVLGIAGLYLEELAIVHDTGNNLVHVVGHVGIVGDNVVQIILHTVDGVGACHTGSLLQIVLWNVAHQLLDHGDSLLLGACGEVCHAALGGMNAGTTQLLLGNNLAQNSLNGTRTCEEHVRGVLYHQGEVGQCGAIYCTTCAGAHNGTDLWNNARCHDIALENLGIASQRVDTLLQTCTT